MARLAKAMQVIESSLPDRGSRLSAEEDGYLMVVADGMGGVAGGEHASALAVATVEDFMLNTLKWFLHLNGSEEHALLAELRAGLGMRRPRRDRPRPVRSELHGMGTTLTMAFSVAADLYLVHAGDTRAYCLHEGDAPAGHERPHPRAVAVSSGAFNQEERRAPAGACRHECDRRPERGGPR